MRTELVGRERELASLVEHLESALAANPRVVLCRGAPRGTGPMSRARGSLRAPRCLSALTCNLLNETVMHGYDIAKAAGRKWRIEPTHAAMVVRQFFVPVLQTVDPRTFVNAEEAAGLQAIYELRLRDGGDRLHVVFDDGSLRVEEPSARRVDCHLSWPIP